MKKTLALLLTLLLILPLFSSCQEKSAFDHPEDYVTLPPLSDIVVKNAEVEEALAELENDVLEAMNGEYFTLLTDKDATAQRGDEVAIRFEGKPTDSTQTLSSDVQALLKEDSAEGYAFVVGSGTLPEAIENAVLDAKVGDTVTATLTYTEDDTDLAELVGVELGFTVELVSISRLLVEEHHAVNLSFTASLADGSEPLDTILTLLAGAVETVDLADSEDTFNTAFTSVELAPHLLGCHKYETVAFTLTLDAARAAAYGYDTDVAIAFEATIREITETPTALTDELVQTLNASLYTTVEEFHTYCLNMVREDLAFQAALDAATFSEDYPEKEFDAFYDENYNAALYSVVGDVSEYTAEELAALMTEEVIDQVESTAYANTVTELRERLLLEYLFDELKVEVSDEEYTASLNELYETYNANYAYMMLYYGIDSTAKLESYLGKDYLTVQLLYQKMLPLLGQAVSYSD